MQRAHALAEAETILDDDASDNVRAVWHSQECGAAPRLLDARLLDGEYSIWPPAVRVMPPPPRVLLQIWKDILHRRSTDVAVWLDAAAMARSRARQLLHVV